MLEMTHRAVVGTVHQHESFTDCAARLVLVAALAVRAPLVRAVFVLPLGRLVPRDVR
jgi:hypothetical protein